MKIFLTGADGFIGSHLVEKLVNLNYQTKVLVMYNSFNSWGWLDTLDKKIRDKIEIFTGDIRDPNCLKEAMKGCDTVIHLANIANDPSVELNPLLSWEVNVLASHQIIEKSYMQGVKHFIYASSGSVYGVKKEKNVTEKLSLDPISTYNKTKMVAESIFLNYKNNMQVHCIRPATVCGLSPRLRLDVSVNLLTYQAVKNKVITVYGGSQIRPNIHIKDLINVYKHFLDHPYLPSGCYNAGFENLSIIDIAKKIKKNVKCKIIIKKNSNDPRSYRQSSDKLLKTGFQPKFGVNFAIKELIKKFRAKSFEEKKINYTVKWMKEIKLN